MILKDSETAELFNAALAALRALRTRAAERADELRRIAKRRQFWIRKENSP
jgi:hypothetical protein